MKKVLKAFLERETMLAARQATINIETEKESRLKPENRSLKYSDETVQTATTLYRFVVVPFGFPAWMFEGYDAVECQDLIAKLKKVLGILENASAKTPETVVPMAGGNGASSSDS